MLVLTRRLNEKIVFPSIAATVEVLGVKSGVVRVGIDAPASVAIFREEVLRRDTARVQTPSPVALPTGKLSMRELQHQLRNRLNTATVGLSLVRRQIQAGMLREAEQTALKVERELVELVDRLNQPVAAPRPAARARRALLVEDDSNECELMAGLLRLAGFDVATAGDGAAALDHLGSHEHPDVVLLDMVLPRCDGPTIVRTLRRDPAYQAMKIFAVTGYPPDQFQLGGGVGVDRWFQKPLNPEAFLRELDQELVA